MKKIIGFQICTIIVLSFMACVSSPPQNSYIKDGKEYGVTRGLFRGKWWNYYERGISFGEGDFLNEAQNDLETAIAQRGRDQRMARTYGMHFIDYFPHRELGIVLLRKGELTKAVRELEISLSGQESAKAKFYLNEARKRKIRSDGKDTSPPLVQISRPMDNNPVNHAEVKIQGQVSDNTFVSSIFINGVPEFIELSEETISFSRSIPLKPGPNPLTIRAEDLAGNVAEKRMTIIADYHGPNISILNYENGQRVDVNDIEIRVSYSDESGIKTLKINGDEKRITEESHFHGTVAAPVSLQNGENKIPVEAWDTAGNRTKGEIRLSYYPGKLVACNSAVTQVLLSKTATDAGYIATKAETPPLKEPDIQPRGLLKVIADHQPLTITNKKINNRIFIEAQVSNDCPVKQILVNDMPVEFQQGKTIAFSRIVDFQEGENIFTITATDAKGNASSKSLTVTRKIQSIDLDQSKMALSIMPFKSDTLSKETKESIPPVFLQELLNLERFKIVERGEDFEPVLKELKLSQTDLVDPDKAVRAGKLLASEAVVTGQVIETKNGIEIFAKLINVETTECLAIQDVYGQDKSKENLRYLLEGLASKLAYSVPVMEGKILGIKGKEIFIDIGTSRYYNLKKGIKCIAYRSEPFILDGVNLGVDTSILGTLSIERANPQFSSTVRVIPESQDVELPVIKKQDLVITK